MSTNLQKVETVVHAASTLCPPIRRASDQRTVCSIAGQLELRRYMPGEVLVMRGDRADGIFVVLGGRVEAFVPRRSGGHRRFACFEPGEVVGNARTLEQFHRFTLMAGGSCEVLFIADCAAAELRLGAASGQ